MIFVGNDLVEVDRIRDIIEERSERFLHRIFTPDAAGRKEPVLFKDIHIRRDPEGAPMVELDSLAEKPQVSISHTSRYAIATAVMELP
jgi:phosphopantetheinyl transferase (holo-ACP synthase)